MRTLKELYSVYENYLLSVRVSRNYLVSMRTLKELSNVYVNYQGTI